MITSTLLGSIPNIQHGFGNRTDAMQQRFQRYWADRPIQRERHGTRVATVDRARQECGEADGMVCREEGLLLAVMTADCVPVLLARRDGSAVAALHVGWRGAFDGIVARFAEQLRAGGDAPENWYAALGPAAHHCCYEVGTELVSQFFDRYALPTTLMARRDDHLNLPGIVAWQLEREGWGGVDIIAACTICSRTSEVADAPFAYHSYRRDKATRTANKDIQWSVIVRDTGAADERRGHVPAEV